MKTKFSKRAEIQKNRTIMPKKWIELFGREFYMDVNWETGIITITPKQKRGEQVWLKKGCSIKE